MRRPLLLEVLVLESWKSYGTIEQHTRLDTMDADVAICSLAMVLLL